MTSITPRPPGPAAPAFLASAPSLPKNNSPAAAAPTTSASTRSTAVYLLGEFAAAAVSGQTYAKFGPRGLGSSSWGKSEIDPKAKFDVDDLSVALIKLKSGRTVLLETSWAAHQSDADYNGTQLFGTEAGLSFPPLRLFRNGQHGYSNELVTHLPNLVGTNRMVHFIEVLLGKEDPYVKPAESLAVQKILDAIYLSARSGKEVRIK